MISCFQSPFFAGFRSGFSVARGVPVGPTYTRKKRNRLNTCGKTLIISYYKELTYKYILGNICFIFLLFRVLWLIDMCCWIMRALLA